MISVQLTYTNVPVEMANKIELTSSPDSVKLRPIATPIEAERAKANIKQVALPQVKPALLKLLPRQKEATTL